MDAWDTGATFITEYCYFDRHKRKQSSIFRLLVLLPGSRKMMKIIHLRFLDS